jgi:hypothetical protein
MNTLGLAAPNRIRCQRTAVARPCRGSLRLRGLVVDKALGLPIPTVDTPCVLTDWPIHESGYGTRMVNGHRRRAHRMAWEAANGPIPVGMVLDHLCRNRACIRLDHLDLTTPEINTLRGLNFTAENARKTYCVHGHALTHENTYVRRNGDRQCRMCRRRLKSPSGHRAAPSSQLLDREPRLGNETLCGECWRPIHAARARFLAGERVIWRHSRTNYEHPDDARMRLEDRELPATDQEDPA